MKKTFNSGTLRPAPRTLLVSCGEILLIGAVLVAINTSSTAQEPVQKSPSPTESIKTNEAKRAKGSDAGSCAVKSDSALKPASEAPVQDAGADGEKTSVEHADKVSSTQLTLRAPSTTDSTKTEFQHNESSSDQQEPSSEEPVRPNAGSAQQCTLPETSHKTEHVTLR